MSLGKLSACSTSTQHKINMKSSSEAELIAVNDVMLLILWTQYFLEAQGYVVHDNKVFQDNKSEYYVVREEQKAFQQPPDLPCQHPVFLRHGSNPIQGSGNQVLPNR